MTDYDETEPLREALAALREIDGEFVDAHADADAEVDHRMRTLRLTVAAIAALADRGEDAPSPDEVREVMRELSLEFALDPGMLLELAAAAREAGDEEDARTLELAYAWHARMHAEPPSTL